MRLSKNAGEPSEKSEKSEKWTEDDKNMNQSAQ